jgi:hypothetical protein
VASTTEEGPTATRRMLRRMKRASISHLEAFRHRRDFSHVRSYCSFLGYPCSGHSIVASLLNAHPRMVIANELDALQLLEEGYSRERVFGLLLARDAEFEANGRILHTMPPYYDLNVPGQSQGSYEQLEVIGDKHGHQTAVRLHRQPDLLDRLRTLIGVPLQVVHVVRNPYDNIATLASRRQHELTTAIEDYAELCEAVADVRSRLAPGELADVRSEDFTADPEKQLAELCRFLHVEPTERYLRDCAGVVRRSVSRTRDGFSWTDADRRRVDGLIERYPVLTGYSFDT